MATDPTPIREAELLDMTKLKFNGLNGEYEAGSDLELGEDVRYTITGYVKFAGEELLEPTSQNDETRKRPVRTIKITGIRRTS